MIHKNHIKGLLSELYVIVLLKLKFYRILHWRYKSKLGEIDIIARKGMTIAAIEVKYRKNLESGLYAVTYNQQKRIKNALIHFGKKYQKHTLRCDICLVTKNLKIHHIQNAF